MSIAQQNWYSGIQLTPEQRAANREENAQQSAKIRQSDAEKMRQKRQVFLELATNAIYDAREFDRIEGWSLPRLEHLPEPKQHELCAAWLECQEISDIEDALVDMLVKSYTFPWRTFHKDSAAEIGAAIQKEFFDYLVSTVQSSDEWMQAERDAYTAISAPPEEY